jgi:hypothetical protein
MIILFVSEFSSNRRSPLKANNPRSLFIQRAEELSRERELIMLRREKLREEKEFQEIQQFSFKPSIPSRSIILAREHRATDQKENENNQRNKTNLFERLYSEAEQRYDQLQLLKRNIEQNRMAECPFKPTVRTCSMSPTERPALHERLADIQKEQYLKHQNLVASVEAEKSTELTFTPNIIAFRPDSHREETESNAVLLDVASRLLQKGQQAEIRRQKLAQQVERVRAAEYYQAGPSKMTQYLAKVNPLLRFIYIDRILILFSK